MPPLRVGHEDAARLLATKLDRIRDKSPGGGVVLYGPRGNGKTVLLGELERAAHKKQVQVIPLLTKLMTGKIEKLAPMLTVEERVRSRRITRLEAEAFDLVKARVVLGEVPVTAVRAVLRDTLKKPLLLLVDEAHVMPPRFGAVLLQAAQSCMNSGLPLLLVLAGTPGVVTKLKKTDASFWERSTQLRVGRLESDETARKALAVPAQRAGMPIDEDALELLVSESQRYPFFVQLLGYDGCDLALRRKGSQRITMADAERGVERVRTYLLKFYKERHSEIDDRGVLAEAEAIAQKIVDRGRDGRLSDEEMEETVRAAASRAGHHPRRVLKTLSHLGLVWRTPTLEWESGIPSLSAFVAERAKRRRGARE